MNVDHLNYQRAARMSILGLIVQALLGLGFLVYGIYARDHAAVTASCFMLLGVPVWFLLAMLFDQHRRERLEALEAESFAASDAATSSVFERSGEDVRVAEKRLKFMYRFVVPAASLGVAAGLIAAGVWRLSSGRELLETFRAVEDRGWPMGLGLGAAFFAFVFARYAAVMAKQAAWAPLRAGAGFAVGTAVLGLVIAVGHLVDIPGPDTILRYLLVVFPVVLIGLGVEIVLNLLLDVYRPRKAGEWPRPAVESRILGFLAAPDKVAASIGEAINYQFGYDVASSWFYRLLSRVFLRVLLPVAAVVAWGMSSLAVVRPHQQGIVERWGSFQRVVGPGLHVKWPWPIERVSIPLHEVRDADGKVVFSSRTVTGVRTLNLGSQVRAGTDPILWTNDHAMQETFFLTQPGLGADTPVEGASGAGIGLAQVAVEFPVHWAIDDLEAYERLGAPEVREDLLRAVAQRELSLYLSGRSVGDLLSDQREVISRQVRERIEGAFTRLNPKQNGRPVVRVIFAGVEGMHPPKDASRAFEGVVTAQQKYTARVNAAQATAVQTLSRSVGSVQLAERVIRELDALQAMPSMVEGKPTPEATAQREKIREMLSEAGGEVAAVLARASAERWERHMGERGRLWAFRGLLGTYKASPALFRAGVYFDALAEAVSNARLVVVSEGLQLEVQFDGQDKDSIQTIFDTNRPQE